MQGVSDEAAQRWRALLTIAPRGDDPLPCLRVARVRAAAEAGDAAKAGPLTPGQSRHGRREGMRRLEQFDSSRTI